MQGITEFHKLELLGLISHHSKIALIKRCKELKLAVASTSDIPMPDESCDIAVCVFAPYAEEEVHSLT